MRFSNNYTTRVFRHGLMAYGICLAGVALWVADAKVTLGLTLGFACGLAVFGLKAAATRRAMTMSPRRGAAFMLGRHYLYLAVYGLALGFAFRTGYVNGYATLAGLLIPNAVLIVDGLFGGGLSRVSPPPRMDNGV